MKENLRIRGEQSELHTKAVLFNNNWFDCFIEPTDVAFKW